MDVYFVFYSKIRKMSRGKKNPRDSFQFTMHNAQCTIEVDCFAIFENQNSEFERCFRRKLDKNACVLWIRNLGENFSGEKLLFIGNWCDLNFGVLTVWVCNFYVVTFLERNSPNFFKTDAVLGAYAAGGRYFFCREKKRRKKAPYKNYVLVNLLRCCGAGWCWLLVWGAYIGSA